MKKAIKGLIISLVTIIVVLLILYGLFIGVGYFKIKKERKELKMGVNEIFNYDEVLGYNLHRNYSVDYYDEGLGVTLKRSTDEVGRRYNPRYPAADRHTLLFGCSYTYGQGCNDDGTMPWFLSQMDTTRNVYNYALEGYGTQHVYDILRQGVKQDVPEERGTAFYMYIEHHRIRSCYSPLVSKWGYDFNAYELDQDGKLVNRGKFHEVYRPGVYFWKGVIQLKLWNALFPVVESLFGDRALNITNDDFMLVVTLILSAQDEYKFQFPDGRFVVVIFPGEHTGMGAVLPQFGLEVLDLSQAVDLHALGGIQQDGFHPNRIGNEAVAELLHEYLQSHPDSTSGPGAFLPGD